MDNVDVSEKAEVKGEVEGENSKTEGKAHKRRKIKEENPKRLKKPKSAFLFYYFDVHRVMQQRTPNMPQSEVNKLISEGWKRLSVADKSYYLERAKLEKEGADTSCFSTFKSQPGFCKILPRTSCFLLPKGSSPSSQPELYVDSSNFLAEGGMQSISLVQASQSTSVGMHTGVELPPVSSSSSKSTDNTNTQGEQCSSLNGVAVKKTETRVNNKGVVQQKQETTTQVVTILPSQNLQEPQSVADIGPLHPVMMISLGAKTEPQPKPSYKMSLKTYTRRGRGRCLKPGCSFVYVTRHKPPICPECGSHLGGKWIPASKKAQAKESPFTAESMHSEDCQSTSPPVQKGDTDVGKKNGSEGSNKDDDQSGGRKQHAMAAGRPPEGSSTKSPKARPQAKRLVMGGADGAVGQTRSRSGGLSHKRPVRPILPALYNTVGPVIQILTVPQEEEKLEEVCITSQETLSGLKPSTLKQLGQTVLTPTASQVSQTTPSKSDESAVADGKVLPLMPFRQYTVSSFDLGLSTARGRGRCKNPLCDYMYKNRHKPAVCPQCGTDLTQKKSKRLKPVGVVS